MLTKDKSITLDYAKALGIISVVIGHYNLNPFGIPHPYLFHMPLFFFIGGMLININKGIYDFAKSVFKKHIIYIIITYLILGIITKIITTTTDSILLNPFPDNFYETIHSIYRSNFHINPLFLVGWFLLAYSFASLISVCIIKLACKTTYSMAYIILAIIVFGYLGGYVFPSKFQPGWHIHFNYLAEFLSGSMYMLTGYILREAIFKFQNINFLFACLILVSFLTTTSQIVMPMTMAFSAYPSGFLISVFVSLLCIYIVFGVAAMMQSLFGKTVFLNIGKSSKTIMSYHLFVMYLLDMLFAKYGMVSMKDVDALHHLYTPMVWPLYILTPVIVLTVANLLYRKLKASCIGYFYKSRTERFSV